MSCVAVDNVAKFDVLQSLQGQEIINSFYFERSSAWAVASLTNAAAGLWIHLSGSYWRSARSDAWTMTGIRVTDLTSLTGPVIDYQSPTGALEGEQTGNPVPNNVAMVVSFRTGLRGRRNRGRHYLAGIPEAFIDGSYWDPAVLTAMENAYEAIFAYMATNWAAAQVVYSCVPTGSPTPDMGSGRTITEWIAQPVNGSQRRRLPGRGR